MSVMMPASDVALLAAAGSRLPPLNASIGFDWRLGPYDVEQSRAHATMLAATGIITDADRDALLGGLDRVADELDGGEFAFRPDDEDIHMAVERRLTEIVGPVGGKLHTARSRNDQVATDMAMFTRAHALRDDRAAAGPAERARAARRGAPRLGDARLHAPAARAAGLPLAPPARVLLDVPARRAALRGRARLDQRAAARRRRAGGRELRDRPRPGRPRARLRRRGAELDRRRLQPRLRARLPRRRGHVRDASVAAGRRDRAVVERGVRLLRGVRRVGVGLLDHAAEEEPGRGRAAARQGAARGGAPGRAARRDARPPADLQQGHAGGQGAPVRRRRHARPVPAGGARDAHRDHVRARAARRRRGRRDDRRDRRRRPARAPRRAVPAVARDRRRARARGGRLRPDAVPALARGARAPLRGARRRVLRRALAARRGWSRRSPRAARRWTGCASSSPTRGRSSTASRA